MDDKAYKLVVRYCEHIAKKFTRLDPHDIVNAFWLRNKEMGREYTGDEDFKVDGKPANKQVLYLCLQRMAWKMHEKNRNYGITYAPKEEERYLHRVFYRGLTDNANPLKDLIHKEAEDKFYDKIGDAISDKTMGRLKKKLGGMSNTQIAHEEGVSRKAVSFQMMQVVDLPPSYFESLAL